MAIKITINSDGGSFTTEIQEPSQEAYTLYSGVIKGPKGDKGDKGEQGIQGEQGADGVSATIEVGTTTTLPADSNALVENVGTSSEAVFNFSIPKGVDGDVTAQQLADGLATKVDKVIGKGLSTNDLTDTLKNTWDNKQDALGYTPENVTNKETTALDTSTIKYPCNAVVKTALDLKANDSSVVHNAGDETIAGEKTFSDGAEFTKGLIAYGRRTPFPTGVGSYIAQYLSTTYGLRLLGYNGVAYQDLKIGSMPTTNVFSSNFKSNGDVDFGYNINITGNCTASSFYGNGSNLTGVQTSIPVASCATASSTPKKEVTISNFNKVDGSSLVLNFDNANTALGGYLKVSFASGSPNDDYGLYTATVIGSPTFTNNKFNSNGNTGLSYPITTLGTGAWCIQGKFKSTNTTTRQQIFNTQKTVRGLEIVKDTTNKLLIYLSSNGSTDFVAGTSGKKSDWSTSTEYYIRTRFTGTQYLVDWSTNGTTWTNDITINSATIITQGLYGVYFGIFPDNTAPLIGTMDDMQVSTGSSTATDTRLGLSVNSETAEPFFNEAHNQINGANYFAYFPANADIRVTYNSTLGGWVITNNVVKSYKNGISWYRIWSDGWIEQGGYVANAPNVTNTEITLVINYKNTNYYPSAIADVRQHWITPVAKTVSKVTFFVNDYGLTTASGFYWKTKGY